MPSTEMPVFSNGKKKHAQLFLFFGNTQCPGVSVKIGEFHIGARSAASRLRGRMTACTTQVTGV